MATIIDDQSLTVSVTSDAVTVTEGDGATFTVAVTGDMSTAHVHVALHGAPDGDIRHGLHGAVGDAGRWVTNVGGDEHDDVGRGLSHSRGNGACAGQRPCPKYKPFSNASPRSDHAGSRPFDATNRNYIAGRANSDQLRKCLNEQVDLVSTTSLLVGDATLSANLAATCAPRIRSAVRAATIRTPSLDDLAPATLAPGALPTKDQPLHRSRTCGFSAPSPTESTFAISATKRSRRYLLSCS